MPTMSTMFDMTDPTSHVCTIFDWCLIEAMIVMTSCTPLLIMNQLCKGSGDVLFIPKGDDDKQPFMPTPTDTQLFRNSIEYLT